MQGDIVENSMFENSGLLAPNGKFYAISEYADDLTCIEHEGLAMALIGDVIYQQDMNSAKDYLINRGWVAVSYMIEGERSS